MHIANSEHQLSEYDPTEVLTHALLWQFLYNMEDRHSRAQLHHQVHVRSRIDDLIQPHDVGMAHR